MLSFESRRLALCLVAGLSPLALGCAGPRAATGVTAAKPPTLEELDALIDAAESALEEAEYARAAASFGRALARSKADDARRPALLLGLASAHERLADCPAAIRALDAYLEGEPQADGAAHALARRGACEAELGEWESSAASYGRVLETTGLLPSLQIEAHARRGYALFMLDRFEEADKTFVEADDVFELAQHQGSERFATYYFVGMARFYRAAILHRRFREIPIRLPETVMKADFERKLALVMEAQAAYNHAIKARHVFWVSAAGYQMGSMLGEFHDALMYAPVPKWLNPEQRKVYYEELKKQLKPVVDRAVWVFEKNLETARRLGYQSEFIASSEQRLAKLRAAMSQSRGGFGEPTPRLVVDPAAPDIRESDGQGLSLADARLFIPEPTPL